MADIRTWEFTHFHAGPLDSGDYVVMFYVGKRSDGLVFVEKRSIATGGCPAREGYSEEYELLGKDIGIQLDGHLHPDCVCGLPEPGSPRGFLIPQSRCPHHQSLKKEG